MSETFKRLDNIETTKERKGPILKKCCCLSLLSGCLILGWLGTLFAATQLALTIEFVESRTSYLRSHGSDSSRVQESIPSQFSLVLNLVIMILRDVVWIVANIFLLLGTYKRTLGYLQTFVRFSIVVVLLSVLSLLVELGRGRIPSVVEYVMVFLKVIFMMFSGAVAYSHRYELIVERTTKGCESFSFIPDPVGVDVLNIVY